jgi:hypothetical protein
MYEYRLTKSSYERIVMPGVSTRERINDPDVEFHHPSGGALRRLLCANVPDCKRALVRDRHDAARVRACAHSVTNHGSGRNVEEQFHRALGGPGLSGCRTAVVDGFRR